MSNYSQIFLNMRRKSPLKPFVKPLFFPDICDNIQDGTE